jgi:hypothetical protein
LAQSEKKKGILETSGILEPLELEATQMKGETLPWRHALDISVIWT